MELQFHAFGNQARRTKEKFSLKSVYQPRFQGTNFGTKFFETRLVFSRDRLVPGQASLMYSKHTKQTGESHFRNMLRRYLFTVVVNQSRSKDDVPRTGLHQETISLLVALVNYVGIHAFFLDPSLPFHKRPCCILSPSILFWCPQVKLTNQRCVIGNENYTL